MDLDKLNKWLTLVANLGVVAGIVFLAIEIRQNQVSIDRNSELMEREYQLQVADGLKAIADSVDEMRLLTAGNEEAARIWLDGAQGKELSEIDNYRFMQMCGLLIWNSAVTYRRSTVLGQFDLAEAEERVTRKQIDSQPGMKKCWDSAVERLRLWGFDDLVDGVANAESL